MLYQVLLILLGLIALGYYFLYFAPKRKIQKFAKEAESLGYKVKLIPFQFMQYYMTPFQEQDNRSLKVFKQQMPHYDLIVGNIFGNMALMPVSTLLLKDFYNQLGKFPKNPFISEVYLKFLNGGLVFSEGQDWRRKRRIISSVFHFDFINDVIPAIQQQIQYFMKDIDNAIQNKKTINIQTLMVRILSSVISRCFFGTDMRDYKVQDKLYGEYFLQFLEELNQFTISPEHGFLGMSGPKYGLTKKCRDLVRKYDLLYAISKQIILKELQKIKNKQVNYKNMLTTLYEANMLNLEGKSNQNQYSIQELIGQFFIFVGAGTDSSSHTLNLIFHYLSEYPQLVDKIRIETENIRQKNVSNSQKVKLMTWIDAIFNQTLRINGPISQIIPRISIETVNLDRLTIPKGTSLNILPLINHYNQDYFNKPNEFNPQRWMGNNKTIEPYSYMPFGGGERNCIGQILAKTQAKLIVSMLLQKYQLKSIHPITMKKFFFFITENGDFQVKYRQKTGQNKQK